MIRLIKTSDLSVHLYEGRAVPDYAILSHRWEAGEISLQELLGNLNQDKKGWIKLRHFCEYAAKKGHEYVWIDTCCIDKTSSAELTEAINSMFDWYRRAKICYAYLCDVEAKGERNRSEWLSVFKRSTWFTRGWTLQELLAPRELMFVCADWEEDIGPRWKLCDEVSEITKVPVKPLAWTWSLRDEFGEKQFTIAQVMSWASERQVTRVEDTAYSLMGLFHINMPLLYGEGQNAFIRLQLEIMAKYDDDSLFAWSIPPQFDLGPTRKISRSLDIAESYQWGGLLAPTIQCFHNGHNITFFKEQDSNGLLFSMTRRGIQVEGPLRRYIDKQEPPRGQPWLLPLNCSMDSFESCKLGLALGSTGIYAARTVNIVESHRELIEWNGDIERALETEEYRCKLFIRQAWPADYDLLPEED